jgi:hypothetical protein
MKDTKPWQFGVRCEGQPQKRNPDQPLSMKDWV